jgi:hypothetical protein
MDSAADLVSPNESLTFSISLERAYYSSPIAAFLRTAPQGILGALAERSTFSVDLSQRDAWLEQISILQRVLPPYAEEGTLYFEYTVPRLGKRIDVLALIRHVIFVIEFKVGEEDFTPHARDQVWDYALDLKNFHETSHGRSIAPILVATRAATPPAAGNLVAEPDGILPPINATPDTLAGVIDEVLQDTPGTLIDVAQWELGRYRPTPTIVEAAMALYGGHSVAEISRREAEAINLSQTAETVSDVIRTARRESHKCICFVTGVPGAGKTLVGLDVATRHFDKASDLYSVFLSGNDPLVAVLRAALARDKVRRERERGRKMKKGEAMSEVKLFIQNVHHFRDECLLDAARPPLEHVALFDEAQRAWNRKQTADFMRRKKNRPDFDQSEPEFLISCLDRHRDWAVVVCLVGGGQEINTGEAGIGEWIDSLTRRFPEWRVFISSRLTDSEYADAAALRQLAERQHVTVRDDLHLSVSMRSFRAEHVSSLVKQLLDLDEAGARATLGQLSDRYPIVITRGLGAAKSWLKKRARGSERYGIVASSQAQRLKPHAIDVRSPIDPVHWFLDPKADVRSSYYLEDAATEFHVQGLELDWACVTWDADFRYRPSGWEHWSFHGSKWKKIHGPVRQTYQKNAYRVLLTRARQGMVIVVPEGDVTDPTRHPAYYDATFRYLQSIGFATI